MKRSGTCPEQQQTCAEFLRQPSDRSRCHRIANDDLVAA